MNRGSQPVRPEPLGVDDVRGVWPSSEKVEAFALARRVTGEGCFLGGLAALLRRWLA